MREHPYIGRYINLDRSPERREVMEAMLAGFDVADRYQRFTAVDGHARTARFSTVSPGELGCFLSHYECLRDAPRGRAIHIVEDDVVFGPRTISLIEQTIHQALEHFEIVFTDIFVPASLVTLRRLMEQFRWSGMLEQRPNEAPRSPKSITFFDLKGMPFAGMISYFVQPGARNKLVGLYEEHLEKGPTMPVDVFIGQAIHDGRLSGACLVPLLSTVTDESVASSTIRATLTNDRSAWSAYLLRYYFYADAKPERLAEIVADLRGSDPHPGYADDLLAGIGFMLGENWVSF